MSYFTGDVDPEEAALESDPSRERRSKTVISQMAKVFRSVSTGRALRSGREEQGRSAGHGLSVGIQYVKALGADSGQLPGASYLILLFSILTHTFL